MLIWKERPDSAGDWLVAWREECNAVMYTHMTVKREQGKLVAYPEYSYKAQQTIAEWESLWNSLCETWLWAKIEEPSAFPERSWVKSHPARGNVRWFKGRARFQ
jgi:hypothetical protein